MLLENLTGCLCLIDKLVQYHLGAHVYSALYYEYITYLNFIQLLLHIFQAKRRLSFKAKGC